MPAPAEGTAAVSTAPAAASNWQPALLGWLHARAERERAPGRAALRHPHSVLTQEHGIHTALQRNVQGRGEEQRGGERGEGQERERQGEGGREVGKEKGGGGGGGGGHSIPAPSD